MKTLFGKIFKGSGKARENFSHVLEIIESRIGLPGLVRGTLNIKLETHYPLTSVDGVITDKEYNHEKECIKLKRCRIKKGKDENVSIKGVIIRPSQHEDPITETRKSHWMRIEVMSNHKIKDKLSVNDGDVVFVEVEEEREINDDWWNRAE